MSIRRDGHHVQQALPEQVTAVLAAAGIPPTKLGAARRSRLTEEEQGLYFWILRRFASHGRPSRARLHNVAAQLCGEPEAAFETLAREDLVHLDPNGEIAVAYPFAGRPTAHRVRFPSGHETYAMCAIDALGIGPMFEETIEIRSQDPLTGVSISGRLAPADDASWEPRTTAVGIGVLDPHGDVCGGCCPVLNFFATRANAKRWFAEHPRMRGQVMSIDDAIAAGGAVFGDVFE